MNIDVPPAWEQVTLAALKGTILVVGAPDTGKSTFACYLYRCLCALRPRERIAFIDGDMGQATLGPPTTMTLALGQPGDDAFPPAGPRHRVFIGDVTPRRHMLPTVLGMHKLAEKARAEGATAIVCDTTGLVNPAHGGDALKWAKIDLLKPAAVFGIQQESELEHLLLPLRLSRRTRVIDLPAAWSAQRREPPVRRQHRADQFRRYFRDARLLDVAWQRLAVFPAPAFTDRRLVALEDGDGFALGLGIVAANDPGRRTVTLHTPLDGLDGVAAIRLGSLAIEPGTFYESRL